MEKENIDPVVDESRRKFLEKAGKASVAAPAAALLLSAGVPQAANAYDPAGGDTTCNGQIVGGFCVDVPLNSD